ncbi:hypothetical protein SAMN00808754_2186 [Thermanaeromonas toyohensis ToBE]|uniref:SgcQ protein n=1 Tax=Thermanaeromonas toyohensis ToBE TaxID=698762 RepID=A0A1W1VXW7_9FIRM|nr:BtpA/SgcQ family protein [Thermanaeromonas toyohensis]SMB98186.1 hypothetical protein SAMN00808754_2186 [Thermanaeromonas toyohensis ToBE]
MNWLESTFGTLKPIIGMIHLKPLPGSPLYNEQGGLQEIIEAAEADLEALQEGGIDGVMFCNENDRPYILRGDAATISAMVRVVTELKKKICVPYGVDVLWDPAGALAVANAVGAYFIREVFTGVYASDMGFWDNRVGEFFRYRRLIGAEHIKLFFNINAEFAAPLGVGRSVVEVARSVAFACLPDVICVSGPMTGSAVEERLLREVKSTVRDIPVFLNTGLRKENAEELLKQADGAIVGSGLKVDGITWNPVDPRRVKELMEVVRRVRGEA